MIVVNSTVLSAPWAPVWFFMDTAVVFQQKVVPRLTRDGINMVDMVAGFKGLVLTTSKRTKANLPESVHLVSAKRMTEFPAPGSELIRWGRSSGQIGLSLAVAKGATRNFLHGFDMRVVDGVEHHHEEYHGRRRDLAIYDRDFIPAFAGWNEQAKRIGVSIFNATPGSALKEFPMMDFAP